MKLLIVTQVVDTEHPILGFFCRWITEFASHCEHVHVICLQAGKHSLPANVTVHSLGKDSGAGRISYLWRFYKLIWQLRSEYENVFVHMNQVYVILGAPLWRVWGKPVGLWYMHGTVSLSLKVAEKFTHRVFTGSPESCRIASSKIVVTGHGIDTEHFKPQTEAVKTIDIITVGRITPSKNLLQLVDILADVRQNHDVSLTLVGSAVTDTEERYEAELHTHVAALSLTPYVHFAGRVPQTELPQTLNSARAFVTAAQNGSLDKAILEAMACGLPVVSMAPGAASLLLGDYQVATPEEFVDRVIELYGGSSSVSLENVRCVKEGHSIQSLIPKILDEYKTK